jgi:hypothetical protein
MRIAVGLIITVCMTTAGLIGVAQLSPARAQVPGMNFPMGGEEKTLTDEEKEKNAARERDYKSSLGKIPDQKAADPWGNIRSNNTPADKNTKKQTGTQQTGTK